MSSIEHQYSSFKKENPWAIDMSFEQWKKDIFQPKIEKISEQIKKLKNNDE